MVDCHWIECGAAPKREKRERVEAAVEEVQVGVLERERHTERGRE